MYQETWAVALAPTVLPRDFSSITFLDWNAAPPSVRWELQARQATIAWQTPGREAERGREGSRGVQALLCVMLGQEAESKARIREQWQIPKPDWRKHSSPGPPAPQGGLPGLAFPGIHLVEGQDPVGQAELRKVKRAVSDSSPASGSRGMRLVISFSPVLNFLESPLAQRLNDKPEHGYT